MVKRVDRKNKVHEQCEELAPDCENRNSKTLEIKEVDIGLDISTSVVGICFLEHSTGDFLSWHSIKLNNIEGFWKKTDEFRVQFQDLIGQRLYVVRRVFVEEHMKMFNQQQSSADTLFLLAKFNGICSYIVYQAFGLEPRDINVVSARARLGIKIDRTNKTKSTKEKVREEVMKIFKDLPIHEHTHVAKTGKRKGEIITNKDLEDMLDAFVLCKAGRIMKPC